MNTISWQPAVTLGDARGAAGRPARVEGNGPGATPDWDVRLPDGTHLSLAGLGAGPKSIGRGTANDIVVAGDEVSRQHGFLSWNDGSLFVWDQSSSNGTWVDGVRLEAGRWHEVPRGSTLVLGTPGAAAEHGAILQCRPTGAAEDLWTSAPEAAGGEPAGDSSLTPRRWAGLSAALKAAWDMVGGAVGVAQQAVAPEDLMGSLEQVATMSVPPERGTLLEAMEGAREAMSATSGVVDLRPGVPTLLVSDIHARREFLLQVLESRVGGERVSDLLERGRVNLVCLGDGMHAEGRRADRWEHADRLLIEGRREEALQVLDGEMAESLGTMMEVMKLKSAFPESFHYIRGNHDDVLGRFRKYSDNVGESELVRQWMADRYGGDFLDRFSRVEGAMPLMARGEGFVASHSAPDRLLDPQAVAARDPESGKSLCWTDNTTPGWENAAHGEMLQANLRAFGAPAGRWFCGHRSVQDGDFRGQFGNQLIQINNPTDLIYAVVDGQGRDVDIVAMAPRPL